MLSERRARVVAASCDARRRRDGRDDHRGGARGVRLAVRARGTRCRRRDVRRRGRSKTIRRRMDAASGRAIGVASIGPQGDEGRRRGCRRCSSRRTRGDAAPAARCMKALHEAARARGYREIGPAHARGVPRGDRAVRGARVREARRSRRRCSRRVTSCTTGWCHRRGERASRRASGRRSAGEAAVGMSLRRVGHVLNRLTIDKCSRFVRSRPIQPVHHFDAAAKAAPAHARKC